MLTLNQILKSLNESEQKQVELLTQFKTHRPTYVCRLAFQLFGPATIKLADDKDKGVLCAEVHWCGPCLEYIANEEFRYISAEFDRDYLSEKTGKHIGAALLAIGLTNRPFVCGMEGVALNEDGKTSHIQVITTGTWFHPWYGEFSVKMPDLDEMVANYKTVLSHVDPELSDSITEMCVDYNHGSLSYGADNAKAAGWVRGAGIYVEKNVKQKSKKATTQSGQVVLTSPVQPEPTQGANAMNVELIRKVLGLSAETEVTETHRDQALVKLSEQTQQLTEEARVVAEGLGVKTLAEAPKMLSEGTLPGRFILTADRHAELLKAETDLKCFQEADPKAPVVVLGKIVLSEDYFKGLEAKAEQGVQANVKLHEMTVDAFLTANVRKFTAAERPRLKERLLADFANVSEDIKARPEITAALFSVTSVGDQAGEGVNGEQVKAFIDKREAELLASGQGLNKSRAYSLACIEAKQKFTKEQYAEFEYPQKQAV